MGAAQFDRNDLDRLAHRLAGRRPRVLAFVTEDDREPCAACNGEGELPRCNAEDRECTCAIATGRPSLECNVRCRSCDGAGRL